jgi:hypothetical protein
LLLRVALSARKRAAVIALRDRRRINEIILRRPKTTLDEKVRLTRREITD